MMRWIKRIFVVLLIFVSFSFSFAAETELEINNSAPELIQNIPDITIYDGDNASNILDLDDYFRDDNGDAFTINYTAITNATLTVDSQNRLSVTYDSGFQGTQSLQITVTDIGGASATSNTFNLIIGPDNEPPKWFSAAINRATVYQNYFVEFSALWTDNAGLSGNILSVNQGSGWSNSSTSNLTGTSNVSKDSLQISASPGTVVFWQVYAFDGRGNYNVTDVFNFTVQEFEVTEADFDEFVDASTTASTDVSTSTGSQTSTTQTGGISTENFQVDVSSIRVSLRQGDSTTRVLRITNLAGTPLNFRSDLERIDALGVLSHDEFTIPAGETFELTLDLLIKRDQMPDEYFGTIVVGAGDSVVIPVVVDVKPFDSAISLTVNVSDDSLFVNQGDVVSALISIRSILDTREGTAELFYALKDFRGNILQSANESFPFLQSFEEERSLVVPEGLSDGEYIFYAIAFFDDRVDLDSDTFVVGFKFRLLLFLKQFLYLLIFVVLIALIIYLYWLYKRNKRKKQLLELYLLLNELRSLVKKGKTQEALGIYKRIKVTYGQKISKEYVKDQTKLKEELDKFAKLLKTTPVMPAATPPAAAPAAAATAAKPGTTSVAKQAVAAKKVVTSKNLQKVSYPSVVGDKKLSSPTKPVQPKPPVAKKSLAKPSTAKPVINKKPSVVKPGKPVQQAVASKKVVIDDKLPAQAKNSVPPVNNKKNLSSPSVVGDKKVSSSTKSVQSSDSSEQAVVDKGEVSDEE